ncbi:MAG: peroxide stress protein YaaA [Gammaproteobacteria bacterium]|nr:peroxide stress protein YaaA [Gammaproteobacteria bacterium]MDP2139613.1 peroxide stress protein YaaA [Gammaproteobacteria bacterium]MDP2346586.1 peroxide stress protein YaaA [Gammaproteobacteria bacterium]
MLVVISPAKTLDYESPVKIRKFTQPDFLQDSLQLVNGLRKLSPAQISDLMSISPALGALNHERFNTWHLPFDRKNARQALFAFKGDVYIGLDALSLSPDDITFAQKHLRILSGLYGLLRPLDLIQPYRLEMGTAWKATGTGSLYEFWGSKITATLNEELRGRRKPVLINLASNEYFKSVKEKQLSADVISPVFKDYKDGQYKLISFFAKKARGLMSAWIIRNRISKPADLLSFDMEGYYYSERDSTPNTPIFLRNNSA